MGAKLISTETRQREQLGADTTEHEGFAKAETLAPKRFELQAHPNPSANSNKNLEVKAIKIPAQGGALKVAKSKSLDLGRSHHLTRMFPPFGP